MNLDEINKNFGLKLFNNPNTLNYNLFNYFLKRKIANRINNDDLIKNYYELGFIKPKLNFSSLANYINENLKQNKFEQQKDLSNNYSIYLDVNEDLKKKIRKYISEDFKEILDKLKFYYHNDIIVSNIEIKRNFGIKDTSHYTLNKREKKDEFYNMYFHCDYYTMNYFKLFINLQEITDEDGPLTFYSIKDTKKFVKESNFLNRTEYKNISLNNEIENCGTLGDCLILNTPQCIHRAGIPKYGNHRDILCVTFVAVYEKTDDIFCYEKSYPKDIWNMEKNIAKKFAKPNNLRNTIKLYNKLTKN
jgi:hypothetical protein